MKKYILAGMLALFACTQANAGFIEGVSGADMVGVEVSVEFSDGSTDSAVWTAMNSTIGAAISLDWGVMLNGDSFGQFDSSTNTFFGMFIISNTSALDMVSLTIEALAAGFVFDTEYGDTSANGSGAGREMVASAPTIVAAYSDNFMDELFGTIMLTSTDGVLVEAGMREAFMTDTDMITSDVPAPAGLLLMALALIGFRATRKA